MRKQIKVPNSGIITGSLNYITGNSYNNRKIADILLKEQKGFCAYTDEYLSRTDAKDIEHFDPTLKDTAADSYDNWFLVKHQWNKEKSYKWSDYQPTLQPTASDFEERVTYFEGDYFADSNDEEAKNLVSLLKLDDVAFAEKRKKYIKRKKEEIVAFGQSEIDFFTTLINKDICQVSYLRAIREEFGVDLWDSLP